MKKIILLTLTIFITLNIISQNKTVEVKLGKGRMLSGVINSKNGVQYIKTTNKSKYGKRQKAKLICFNENLEKTYEIDIKGRNKPGAAFVMATSFYNTEEPSNYGNYFLNEDQLIDKNGKIHHFEVDYRKQNHVNPIFSFFSDFGWSFIGPRKGRKYYKKKYTNDDINIYTIKNSDSKTILEKLKTPKINYNGDIITWHLGDNYPNKFFMIAKDKINEEMNIDTYHMVSYDYSGNPLAYTSLKIKLDDNKYLAKSSNGGPTEFESNFGKFSFGNVFYDNNEETFYVYGIFSNLREKEKSVNYKVAGFYLHKFDMKGNIVWKKNYLLNKPVSKFITEINLELKEINKNLLIDFSFGINGKINSKIGGFYYINSENGKLIKNVNPYKNYFVKRLMTSTSSSSQEKSNMGGKFFINKSNKKIFATNNVLASYIINPKIQKYIESKNKILFYNASFTNDGVILKEFNQKDRVLKLLLFKN